MCLPLATEVHVTGNSIEVEYDPDRVQSPDYEDNPPGYNINIYNNVNPEHSIQHVSDPK